MIKRLFKKLLRMLLWTLGILVGLVLIVLLYIQIDPVFGANPDRSLMAKLAIEAQYDGKKFLNKEATQVMTSTKDSLAWPDTQTNMLGSLAPPKGKNPQQPLPSLKFDKTQFIPGSFAWFGHSTIMMNVDDTNIIIDPVFYRASPVFFAGKPFPLGERPTIAELPEIDVVLISHDHYDHLDMKAIKEMDPMVKQYLVPLGIKAHLLKWGVDSAKVQEFDWYQEQYFKGVKFTFTPSRHFSGRGIFNRASTLWGSWIVKGSSQNIYLTGDSGYTEDFAKIGAKYGPFDIAFVENGAYNSGWAEIHMFPEQSVQAGIDLQAKMLFPIHWGKFDLSLHNWKEPIERFKTSAEQREQFVVTAKIGSIFNTENPPQDNWWQ
ncbi:MBL fold metallo-hydrolase [Gilvibacter sp.]|uniref:MBL fold metallo-hydrolase n=1 Tax=Gilvibacter sp. TaxID=2729997 RepID=UPI003F49B677